MIATNHLFLEMHGSNLNPIATNYMIFYSYSRMGDRLDMVAFFQGMVAKGIKHNRVIFQIVLIYYCIGNMVGSIEVSGHKIGDQSYFNCF